MGATAPPPGKRVRIRLLVLVSASLRTAKIRVVKDWGERGGWAALSTGTLFETDYDHLRRSAVAQAAIRSFFVLMLCSPPVNEKREQTEINNAQRSLPHIFSTANSTTSKYRSDQGSSDRAPHPPHVLRGSIHTVSLKCAQSCPRDDQIARRAVAPAPNHRHYVLTLGSHRPAKLRARKSRVERATGCSILMRRPLTVAGRDHATRLQMMR